MIPPLLSLALASAPSVNSLPSPSTLGRVRAEAYLWQDFDRDGLDDLYTRAPGQPDRLLRNRDGSFEDATAALGLADVGGSRSATWTDIDVDGLPDLFVLDASGRCRLFHNAGASFSEVTESAGIVHPVPARFVEWIDMDHDGSPDLHVVACDSDTIFANLGAGRFSAVALPMVPGAVPVDDDSGAPSFGVATSAFASGPSNTPGTTMQFLSPPVTVTLVGGESVFVSASRAFGSINPAGAQSLSLYIGRRLLPSGVIQVGGNAGMIGNRVTRNSRQTFSMSAVISGLAAGDYEVGLVGGSANLYWNNNGNGYTSALVLDP